MNEAELRKALQEEIKKLKAELSKQSKKQFDEMKKLIAEAFKAQGNEEQLKADIRVLRNENSRLAEENEGLKRTDSCNKCKYIKCAGTVYPCNICASNYVDKYEPMGEGKA